MVDTMRPWERATEELSTQNKSKTAGHNILICFAPHQSGPPYGTLLEAIERTSLVHGFQKHRRHLRKTQD